MEEEQKKEEVKTETEETKQETKEVKEETKEKEKPSSAKASEAKEEKPVKVPAKFKKLVEEVEKMSVLDLAELVKVLEKKFGVSATAPVMSSPAAAAPGVAPAEQKSVFNIVLTEVGGKKIEVIKAVRDVTQKGLKESKDLVDEVASGPQVVKENVKKEEAEEIKKKFETAGAKLELK